MVEGKADTPRSYNIHTDRGQRLHRNRRHLVKTTEIFYDCQEEIQSDNNSVSNKNTSNSTKCRRKVYIKWIPTKYEDFAMK